MLLDSANYSAQEWGPLAIGTAATVAAVSYYFYSKSDLKAQKMQNGSAQPTLFRVPANNFGFGDVHVSKLLVHPIKSCRGTSVQQSNYSPEGLEYDRRWCIIDANTKDALTAREEPTMVLITPCIDRDSAVLSVSFPEPNTDSFTVPLEPTAEQLSQWTMFEDVKMWGGTIQSFICQSSDPSGLTPSALLSAYLGRPVHLVYKPSQSQLATHLPRICDPTDSFPSLKASFVYQDGYPLLLLSEESVQEISREVKEYAGGSGAPHSKAGVISGIENAWKTEDVTIDRFRPNIILKGAGAFGEDLMDEVLIIPRGEAGGIVSEHPNNKFLIVSKCTRCLLPNVDPSTGIRDAAVPFKVLMKFRTGIDPKLKSKACVGCNGVPLGEGTIRVGDKVLVKKVSG